MIRLLPLGLAACLLVGCGQGDDDDAPASSPTTPPSTAPSTTVAPTTVPPTTAPPAPAQLPGGSLEVLVVGDSVMHDASAAIEAVLTATGAATPRPGSAFGLGFSDGAAIPFAGAADELLSGGPTEQVVVMIGSWDHLAAQRDPEAYAQVVREGLTTLAEGGRQVLVLGELPSDPAKGEEPARTAVNDVLAAEAEALPRVRFLETDTVIGDANGDFVLRDGDELLRKPDGRHLCPAGAQRVGTAVLRALMEDWTLPAPPPEWSLGEWRSDPRYNDPPGGCVG